MWTCICPPRVGSSAHSFPRCRLTLQRLQSGKLDSPSVRSGPFINLDGTISWVGGGLPVSPAARVLLGQEEHKRENDTPHLPQVRPDLHR